MSETGFLYAKNIDHKKLYELFNFEAYGFVGAIYDCNTFALAYTHGEQFTVNAVAARYPEFFEENVRGPIVFVGSDDDGYECDIDVNILAKTLNIPISF